MQEEKHGEVGCWDCSIESGCYGDFEGEKWHGSGNECREDKLHGWLRKTRMMMMWRISRRCGGKSCLPEASDPMFPSTACPPPPPPPLPLPPTIALFTVMMNGHCYCCYCLPLRAICLNKLREGNNGDEGNAWRMIHISVVVFLNSICSGKCREWIVEGILTVIDTYYVICYLYTIYYVVYPLRFRLALIGISMFPSILFRWKEHFLCLCLVTMLTV